MCTLGKQRSPIMAGCMRFCHEASIAFLILTVLFLNCLLGEENGQGMSTDSAPNGQSDPDPLRRLFENSSFQPAGTEPCHHQRNVTELEKQLWKLRTHVVQGDLAGVQSLLNKWSSKETYVHNLNDLSTNQSYSQIQCSDLDFLAQHQVRIEQSVYDDAYQKIYGDTYQETLADVSYMTILELALHMTRCANERALTLAMTQRNETRVGNEGERFEERMNIIRLLLEKGFLWSSSDLVCKVVPKENGYRKNIREAFARTILHDLVRDPVHLNKSRIKFLRKECAGNGMDGVVWILGSAPGAFSLLGFLSHQTVLMGAAQDDSNHDEAFINFPELIRLHKVLQAPLTTVDLDGWNAEMYAAYALKAEHVSLLKETILEKWRQQGRDAFNLIFLGDPASDWLSNACIFLTLHVSFLGYAGFAIFFCIWLFDATLLLCKAVCSNEGMLNRLLSWLEVFAGCRWTFRGSEMFFRVLWLLTLNIAFLNVPPHVAIAWERRVSPLEIPSVSKWNPLPVTVHSICLFSIILFFIFALSDYMHARQKAAADEHPLPAVPEDRYQDPNCHLIGCVCVFGLVTLLMIIYLQIVLRPLEMDPKRIALWFGSLLVQIKITLEETLSLRARRALRNAFSGGGTANSQGYDSLDCHELLTEKRYEAVRNAMHHWHRWACCMVKTCNPEIWHLLMVAHKKKVPLGREGLPAEIQWSRPEIIARFLMSYMSNGLYRALIVYTLPLWLCRGGLTDFVLNAFATVYIVELDDLTGRDEWKLLSEEDLRNFRYRCRSATDSSEASSEQSA